MKYIYLYRHGETDWNVNGITMGQLEGIETSFTEKGYQELLSISESMKESHIEIIYSSDFKRTIETAKLASVQNNVPIIVTKRVRGLNMGKYQGQAFESFINSIDVKRSFADYDIPFPNGESINQLNNRLVTFIKDTCETTPYSRIAIVTHSAAISNLKNFVTQDPYVSLDRCVFQYENGKLTLLDYQTVNGDKPKQKAIE